MIAQKGLDNTTSFSTDGIGRCVVGNDQQCSTTTDTHFDDSRWRSTTRKWQRRPTTMTAWTTWWQQSTLNESFQVLTRTSLDPDNNNCNLTLNKYTCLHGNISPLFCAPLPCKPHQVCCVGTALLPWPCPPQLLTLPVLIVSDVQAMHGVIWSSTEKAWSGWLCFLVLSNKCPWQTLDHCSECEGACYRVYSQT